MPSPIHLSQAIEEFFTCRGCSFSPTTVENYRWALSKLQKHIGDPLLSDILPRDIDLVLEKEKALSGKSLLNLHAVYSSLWRWCVQYGYVSRNIVQLVPSPRAEERVISPFTADDIHALLKACEYSRPYCQRGSYCRHRRPTLLRDRAIILLLLDTGVRASELCKARVKDLDLRNHRLVVLGKRSKERIVVLSDKTCKVLARYLEARSYVRSDPLFVGIGGKQMSRTALHRLLKRLGERAGVSNVHPHRFRHTFAICYLRNGGDIFTLKALLGHSSWEMINHYLALAHADVEAVHQLASPVSNWL